jgi:hypothetical protein
MRVMFATAMIGLPVSSLATPVARSGARAPAMFLPCLTVRDRSGGIPISPQRGLGLLTGLASSASAYRGRTGRKVPITPPRNPS